MDDNDDCCELSPQEVAEYSYSLTRRRRSNTPLERVDAPLGQQQDVGIKSFVRGSFESFERKAKAPRFQGGAGPGPGPGPGNAISSLVVSQHEGGVHGSARSFLLRIPGHGPPREMLEPATLQGRQCRPPVQAIPWREHATQHATQHAIQHATQHMTQQATQQATPWREQTTLQCSLPVQATCSWQVLEAAGNIPLVPRGSIRAASRTPRCLPSPHEMVLAVDEAPRLVKTEIVTATAKATARVTVTATAPAPATATAPARVTAPTRVTATSPAPASPSHSEEEEEEDEDEEESEDEDEEEEGEDEGLEGAGEGWAEEYGGEGRASAAAGTDAEDDARALAFILGQQDGAAGAPAAPDAAPIAAGPCPAAALAAHAAGAWPIEAPALAGAAPGLAPAAPHAAPAPAPALAGAAPALAGAAAKTPRKRRTGWTPEKIALFNHLTQQKHGATYVAKALGMNVRTVQRMRTSLLTMDSETPQLAVHKARAPGGKVERQSTRKLKAAILQICCEDPTYTAHGIAGRLGEMGFGREGTSERNLMRLLRKMGLTKKNVVYSLQDRNLQENIEERRVFCQEIGDIPVENVLYLDECAFNTHVTPRQGWAAHDAPAIYKRPAPRSGNVSLLLTIGLHGPVEWALLPGDSLTPHRILDYVTGNLLPALQQEEWRAPLAPGAAPGQAGPPGTTTFQGQVLATQSTRLAEAGWCIVMGSASAHNNLETQSLFQKAGVRLLFLPPHSPQLNPMEEVLGELRTRFSRECPAPGTVAAQMECLGRILGDMKGTSMRGYYDRAARYYPECIAGLPLVSKP